MLLSWVEVCPLSIIVLVVVGGTIAVNAKHSMPAGQFTSDSLLISTASSGGATCLFLPKIVFCAVTLFKLCHLFGDAKSTMI